MTKPSESQVVPVETIERRIYLIRGQKVMLDADLAFLYQVRTKALNQAVQRNLKRFPADFMFRLPEKEAEPMWSQSVTTSKKKRRISNLPYAFTEHGVAMLSAVLHSERAILMSILVVRAFVRIRELLAHNKDLAVRVEKLEAAQQEQNSIIHLLANEIDGMKKQPEPKRRGIGFTAKWDE